MGPHLLTVSPGFQVPSKTTTSLPPPNMLPAVAQDVLSANPNFDALYRDLCVNKLNVNATTRIDPKVQKERNAFDEVGDNTGMVFSSTSFSDWRTNHVTGAEESAKRGSETKCDQVLSRLSIS